MEILLTHATVATMVGGYGLLPHAAVAVQGDKIAWVGPMEAIPAPFRTLETHDCGGQLLTPGLIDCHTHVVFAGNRAGEFEARLNGASYADIAHAGGGILSTVTATRAATMDDLIAQSLPRVDQMIASGATTIEIKSGYGLDIASELTILRAARKIATLRNITVKVTHLAAHAIPPEYAGNPDAYIEDIAIPSLQLAHAEGLIDAVDAFCETIAFTPAQVERVFRAAKALDLPVKLHAEQLTDQGGATLAAKYNALSADHLEYLSPTGIAAMAAAKTTAVILPGAFYTLRETQMPPIAALRAASVPMAIATDCNPGSSPMTSLPLAMNMACTLFRMTPCEALAGTTIHAARALALHDRGTIAAGQRADLCLWNATHPAEIAYLIAAHPQKRMCGGRFDA